VAGHVTWKTHHHWSAVSGAPVLPHRPLRLRGRFNGHHPGRAAVSRIVTERETKSFGANSIGLERRGFSPERVKTLQRAFRTLLRAKLNTSQALAALRSDFADSTMFASWSNLSKLPSAAS